MEKNTNIVESISKIVTALVAAGGFVWGIIEFQQRQLFNETQDFRRKLWEKRLSTYNVLQDVTGLIIVKRNDPKTLDSLRIEFDKLYYSAMILVEDPMVETKMVAFSEALNDFEEGIKGDNYLKRKQIDLMKELSISLKRKQKLLFDEEQ